MRVYLAGPMTGYWQHNFEAFFEAEEILRREGYDVVNPARNQGGNTPEEAHWNHIADPHPWEWYLKIDLRSLLTCDAVFTIQGWEASRGAQLEVYVAKQVGMTVVHDYDLFRELEWTS